MWYNPGGIANIMSIWRMSKYYQITMDTLTHNSLVVHLGDGERLEFTPSQKGLYKVKMDAQPKWAMIQTIRATPKDIQSTRSGQHRRPDGSNKS